jgi:pimeloyl-ACP methyl ester carboxylesterase
VPYAPAADGVNLYYEETGQGFPVLFVHELAGDLESWEPQLRFFGRRYRCIAYNARGYPPSEVPDDPAAYSQEIAVDDAVAVLDAAGVAQAHVVGLSMGGFTTLNLTMRRPDVVRSAVVAGAGYGAHPDVQDSFPAEIEIIARAFEQEGSAKVAERFAVGPARVQFQNKDSRGWAEFARRLGGHSSAGAGHTLRGVQKARTSLFDLTDRLARIEVPMLIITGDEDESCLEPGLMLRRTIPAAGLLVVPKTGHTVNLEEPQLFNDAVASFFAAVEHGAWQPRDPRSLTRSTTGMPES